jgi:uncharacterized protein
MTKKLHISPTLALPLDFVTSTQAILAKKGKGKTYKASVQAEELLDANQQIVAIDPTGAWYGLRSSADGKHAGYPVTIFGGEHADVPLESTAGEVIAEAIATEHFSAVIDLTLFRKGEALRFMAAFLETLYRKNREALHLFIDEADVVAPQKTFGPDEARVLGACEDIVRRGRIRGIGCTLITQRPQVLNKNVLSQVDMLTALGMNHPKDIGAIKDWVAVHGDEAQAKQMIADLPALPIGEAWVWAPAADIFKRVTFRDRRTFDSGKTPKAGERRAVPKVLAEVDIAKLGARIASTVELAKANDPKTLKARIAELEKQVAVRPSTKVETKTVEKPIIKEAQLQRIGVLIEQGERLTERLMAAAKGAHDGFSKVVDQAAAIGLKIETALGEMRSALRAPQPIIPASPRIAMSRSHSPIVPAMTKRRQNVSSDIPGATLPVGEAATLRALIQYPDGLRREQLTVLTGYKRSTRDAYIQRLREKGFCDTNGERVIVTQAGVDAMPDAEPLPTGEALQQWWLPRLPMGEGVVLEELIKRYPDVMQRDEITDKTGYKRSTRDAYLQRLEAKQLVVDLGRSSVKASDTLFEVQP